MSTEAFLGGVAGSIFFLASMSKIIAPARVTSFLGQLGFSSDSSQMLARGLTVIELGLAITLVTPSLRIFASVAAAFLASSFVAVQIYAAQRGISDCGCFAFDNGGTGLLAISRAIFLAVISITLASQALNGREATHSQDVLLGILTGVVAIVAFELLQQVSHFEKTRREVGSASQASR